MNTVKKRDWKTYNQKLIKRGEFYLNPVFLDNWRDEIKRMNLRKVGQPFLYPESMIEFLGVLWVKGFDFRTLEGIVSSLSKRMFSFPVISYSQISRRIKKLKIKFQNSGKNLIVAGDGSGLKTSNRGEWMRQKWKVRRGWIKVVVFGSVNGSVVDVRTGADNLDERKAVRGMIRKNYKKINKVIMDGLHDCRDTFNLCEKLKVKPVIKIRKNAVARLHGCILRKREVVDYKRMGHGEWCKNRGYGLRWPASEGIFSAVKRIFGENIRSMKRRNAYHEAKMKFWAYNRILDVC